MWHQPREFKSAPRGFVVITHILWPWDLVQTSPLKITHIFIPSSASTVSQTNRHCTMSSWKSIILRTCFCTGTSSCCYFCSFDAFAARLWCCLSVVSTPSLWSPSVSHHRLHYRCLPSFQSFCPQYHHHRQAWIDACGVCVLFPGQADELGAVLACIH